MKLGDTYLLIGGHLWIVVSLPTSEGALAFVSMTTHRRGVDENCVLDVGDHPFVRHRTVISYQHARLIGPTEQSKVLGFPDLAPPREPVSKALLRRIQEGALKSDFTPQKVQAVIADSMKRQA